VLRRIFTPDARANYSDPLGVLNGVDAIINTLPAGLTLFASTQHMYGTQYIETCSLTSALSITYSQATHFFTPYAGVTSPVDGSQVLVDRGMYQDTWARQGNGTWKITNRKLVRMVSFLGFLL
jgi:SnoaL-like domain